MGAAPYDMDRGCGRWAIRESPLRGIIENACHSERSDEGAKSKNLRIINSAKQFLGAKILRRGFALLRMTEGEENWQLLPSQSR